MNGIRINTRSEIFQADASVPDATFTWDKEGKYTVALRGSSINGESDVKKVKVWVSSHEYKDENITFADFLLLEIPNEIITFSWGEDAADITSTIISSIKHVQWAEIYERQGKFSGYRFYLSYPSDLEPTVYDDLVNAVNSRFGQSQASFDAPTWDTQSGKLWEMEDFYIKVGGNYYRPQGAEVEVLYKPMWDKAELEKEIFTWGRLFK